MPSWHSVLYLPLFYVLTHCAITDPGQLSALDAMVDVGMFDSYNAMVRTAAESYS